MTRRVRAAAALEEAEYFVDRRNPMIVRELFCYRSSFNRSMASLEKFT